MQVILGLGSNQGHRLQNLRQAINALERHQVVRVIKISPVYHSTALLPEDAPDHWNQYFLNIACLCDTNLDPHTLLSKIKQIEFEMGRDLQAPRWSPRVIDIDILAGEGWEIATPELTIPHAQLLARPFALWPLADVAPDLSFPRKSVIPAQAGIHPDEPSLLQYNSEYSDTSRWIPACAGMTTYVAMATWGSRFSGDAPFQTRQIPHRITPQLVGIVNVTPDSFSDGGQFLSADAAVAQATQLVAQGAEILDIGAESTAPNAPTLDAATEWQRLEPVLAGIRAATNQFLIQPIISIDTRHIETAQKAIAYDVDWINDVSGLDQQGMRNLVASTGKTCVIMHSLSIPASREHVLPHDQDPVKLVFDWGVDKIKQLEQLGITRNQIIFDPGIGFGKTADQSLRLIKHAHKFKELGVQILYGHSRKSFLSLLTPAVAKDRDIETAAIAVQLANQQIDYLRIHNVSLCARTLASFSYCS